MNECAKINLINERYLNVFGTWEKYRSVRTVLLRRDQKHPEPIDPVKKVRRARRTNGVELERRNPGGVLRIFPADNIKKCFLQVLRDRSGLS